MNYAENTKKNTDLRQQMSAQNVTHKMVRQGIQNYAVGKEQTTDSRKRNEEEKMEVDRTRTEETSNKHHTTSTYTEPREEKKRKAEKHMEERHRKRKKEVGYTWREMEKMTTNRQEWRPMADGRWPMADGQCSQRANRSK